MAARKNKLGLDENWRFYVYEILDHKGTVVYVGKGSGRRVDVSMRARNGSASRKVALFKRERDAYAYEVEHIAEVSPVLNKIAGGNGPRCQVVKTRKSKEEREIEAVGTRVYAARYLLQKIKAINELRLIAGYPQDLLDTIDRINVPKLYEVAYCG